jgi:histidine triad (HIT) family protein
MSCLFCRIIAGEIPSTVVYQDEDVIAFRDIDPKAPVHVLCVPRRHVASALELEGAGLTIAGRLLAAATAEARQEGLDAPGRGFRLVINTGPDGGQSVDHLHVHLLGGRALAWPPG